MAKTKVSPKTESNLLLNIKDIEKLKATNANSKFEHKAKTLEGELEKYNQSYLKALNAPIPDIKLHFSQVLVRAVPIEVKSKSGLIIGMPGETDIKIADRLSRVSDAVQQHQEILLVGDHVTKEEREAGLRPGRMCKMSLKGFRTMSDRHLPGNIEMEYEIPIEIIDGYKYILLDKRDILYTYDKK